jgi:hypothetical protein
MSRCLCFIIDLYRPIVLAVPSEEETLVALTVTCNANLFDTHPADVLLTIILVGLNVNFTAVKRSIPV